MSRAHLLCVVRFLRMEKTKNCNVVRWRASPDLVAAATEQLIWATIFRRFRSYTTLENDKSAYSPPMIFHTIFINKIIPKKTPYEKFVIWIFKGIFICSTSLKQHVLWKNGIRNLSFNYCKYDFFILLYQMNWKSYENWVSNKNIYVCTSINHVDSFLDVFDLLPPFWTNLLNFRHLISVYSLPHVGMCGQNTENIPRWFYVSFPTVFYNISGRRRTAKCNSSVSTDDHEDDFLTLEIHQEHCDQIESQSWHEESSVFGSNLDPHKFT